GAAMPWRSSAYSRRASRRSFGRACTNWPHSVENACAPCALERRKAGRVRGALHRSNRIVRLSRRAISNRLDRRSVGRKISGDPASFRRAHGDSQSGAGGKAAGDKIRRPERKFRRSPSLRHFCKRAPLAMRCPGGRARPGQQYLVDEMLGSQTIKQCTGKKLASGGRDLPPALKRAQALSIGIGQAEPLREPLAGLGGAKAQLTQTPHPASP